MNIIKDETGPKTLEVNEVTVRDPLVKDLIQAERIAGAQTGYKFLNSVISQCCTFDGKKLPPEETERLTMADFLDLTDELHLNGQVATSPDTSSTLSGKESGESLPS